MFLKIDQEIILENTSAEIERLTQQRDKNLTIASTAISDWDRQSAERVAIACQHSIDAFVADLAFFRRLFGVDNEEERMVDEETVD